MKDRNVVRDVSLLMIGVTVVVVFSALLILDQDVETPPVIEDLSTEALYGSLLNVEFRRLLSDAFVKTDTTIAIAENLDGVVKEAIKELGFFWGEPSDWSGNQGIPPPGVVLVDAVQIDGNRGFVSVVVGERASSLSCGISIESRYVWDGRWGQRSSLTSIC